MFALYLVLMLLIFEIIALIIYLLPVPRFLLRMMSSLTSQLRLPIRIILAFLGYFVFDSFMEMRKYETREPPSGDGQKLLFLTSKFRSERNFYLMTFTFTLLVILLRVESLLIRTEKLEDELQTLKGDTQKKEDSEATESLSLKEKKRQ